MGDLTTHSGPKTLLEKSLDPLWDDLVRIFQEANEARRVHQSKMLEGICLIAKLYQREQHRWEKFLAERGVRRPKFGPASPSKFHALAKFVLQIDRDDDGRASK